jgi:hypothetical protein
MDDKADPALSSLKIISQLIALNQDQFNESSRGSIGKGALEREHWKGSEGNSPWLSRHY